MISNPSTAAPQPPQPARQAALNAVLRRLVAVPPPARNGAAPLPRPVLPPVAPAPSHAPVPRWLTAPVLGLAIPHSPLAAGTVPSPPPAPPPPPPKPEPAPEATASEVLDVPPLVEPIAEAKPEPAPDLPARIMSEIAAIVARAPEAIAPVTVDLSVLTVPEPPIAPAAPPPAPAAVAAPAAPGPAPTPPPPPKRAEPARRVTVRRARPRVLHPQRRITAPPPLARTPGVKLAGDGTKSARQRIPSPQPAPSPEAKAPTPARPALAPAAAAAVARTISTTPAPAAVPETRPLTQNRRLYRRVRLMAELEVAGKPCRLIDLSIGGFAAAGADRLDSGALVPVTLRMTIDGINIGTQFSARMVYGNGARAAGRFVDLTGAQTAFLRYIVTWRGEAIGAVGTTTLLDAITRWPERAFQPHPSTVKPPEPERPGFWSRLVSRIPLLGWRKRE